VLGRTRNKMKKQKEYFRLTLVVLVLLGIILPLAMGVKDLYSIALILTLIWFIYAGLRLVTVFVIKPGLKIKASRRNEVSVVKFELTRKGSE
jgi:hypothetical protein